MEGYGRPESEHHRAMIATKWFDRQRGTEGAWKPT